VTYWEGFASGGLIGVGVGFCLAVSALVVIAVFRKDQDAD